MRYSAVGRVARAVPASGFEYLLLVRRCLFGPAGSAFFCAGPWAGETGLEWFELAASRADLTREPVARLWLCLYPAAGGHLSVAFVSMGKTVVQRECRMRRLEQAARPCFAGAV